MENLTSIGTNNTNFPEETKTHFRTKKKSEAERGADLKPQTVREDGSSRSPCEDAHYEAFILRSSWAVGSLYAANLQLGQSYVKQVQDMEKQRKAWLSRKEQEQESMKKRLAMLQNKAKSCHYSRTDSKSAGNHFEHGSRQSVERKPRLRYVTEPGTCSRVNHLEELGAFETTPQLKKRSMSQPVDHTYSRRHTAMENFKLGHQDFQQNETRLICRKLPRAHSETSVSNLRPAKHVISSIFTPGQTLRRTTSSISSSVKFSRYYTAEDATLTADKDLMPRWLPTNMRSKNIGGKSLF